MRPPTFKALQQLSPREAADALLTENSDTEPWNSPRGEKTWNPQFLTDTLGKKLDVLELIGGGWAILSLSRFAIVHLRPGRRLISRSNQTLSC